MNNNLKKWTIWLNEFYFLKKKMRTYTLNEWFDS